MKHSYLLTAKITPDVDNWGCFIKGWGHCINRWFIGVYRSSRLDVFCRKIVLRNFAKFTGKHLCQGVFFDKVAGLRPKACKFIKKEILVQGFSCEFYEIFKNTFFYRTPPVTASINERSQLKLCVVSKRINCGNDYLESFFKSSCNYHQTHVK